MNGFEPTSFRTGAMLDMTTVTWMVPLEDLLPGLQRAGVELQPVRDVPTGKHPIVIDLWRVESGRLESVGVDQHDWYEATGSVATALLGAWLGAAGGSTLGSARGTTVGALLGSPWGPLGWWSGSVVGWLHGALLGGALAATTSAAKGAELGRGAARDWSQGISRVLGTYDEAMVTVPNVALRGRADKQYSLVMGMFSNGPVSVWGDRTFGYGYRKRLARISRVGFDSYKIVDGDQPVLSAQFTHLGQTSWTHATSALEHHRALFAQPLLGVLPNGAYAVTRLYRAFDDRQVRLAPASGRVRVDYPLADGLQPGEFMAEGIDTSRPWGAFHATKVITRLSAPTHFLR